MRIEWATSAQKNLQELYDFISKDSPRNAERFIARLFDAIDLLADQPKMGRPVPEADNRDDVRELIFQNYRIIYYLEAEYVYIVDGSRIMASLVLQILKIMQTDIEMSPDSNTWGTVAFPRVNESPDSGIR